jgi:hypothetical protein
MKSKKLLIALSLAFSGCVSRPNTDLCVINAAALNRGCYNMHEDFNADGSLKSGAVMKIRPNATIQDLDKAVIVDGPDAQNGFEEGWARLKAYLKKLEIENSSKN